MVKNKKTTLEKLEGLVNIVAINLAEVKSNMATKDDLKAFATKIDLEDMERRLSAKIDAVEEKVDALEETDVRDLQKRVYTLEKNVKQLKHKHV